MNATTADDGRRAAASAAVDHLVVLAPSLGRGVAWCEDVLGVTPGPGGTHPLMGTHNRLLKVASPVFARAYLEIIAIDPAAAARDRAAGMRRWFDMDAAPLQRQMAEHGPRLIHFVARVPRLHAALAALAALGIDRGSAVDASREAAAGLLRWRISLRGDGQRLFEGTLPTLIEWGDVHPVDAMADSGVSLQALSVRHPRATTLEAAFDALGLADVPAEAGPARLHARLSTPRGPVDLFSP